MVIRMAIRAQARTNRKKRAGVKGQGPGDRVGRPYEGRRKNAPPAGVPRMVIRLKHQGASQVKNKKKGTGAKDKGRATGSVAPTRGVERTPRRPGVLRVVIRLKQQGVSRVKAKGRGKKKRIGAKGKGAGR